MYNNYAWDMEIIEKVIIYTYDLLMNFEKIEDFVTLLDGSIDIFT